MTKQEFISGLQEELELEVVLNSSSILKDMDEWDSMAAMLLIGYVSNELGVTLNSDDLKDMTTVESLMDKIGAGKFD